MVTQRPLSLSQRRSRRSRRVAGPFSRGYSSRYSTRNARALTTPQRRTWPSPYIDRGLAWDPFPKRASAIMRYTQVVDLDPPAGSPAYHLFRCNSIFDPDYSGVGTQPYGHDTYQSIYNHYMVKKAVITMTPTQATNGIMGISVTDDATVAIGYTHIRNTKTTKMAVLTSSAITPSVVNYYNVNQNFDESYQGETSARFGSNPNDNMLWQCWFEGPSAADNAPSNSFLITVTYYVDMWELKDLNAS